MNNNGMINRTIEVIPMFKRTYVMGSIENMYHYTKQVDDNITFFIYVGKVNGILTKYLSPTIWNGYMEVMFSIDDNEIVYFSDENEIYVWEGDEWEFYKY